MDRRTFLGGSLMILPGLNGGLLLGGGAGGGGSGITRDPDWENVLVQISGEEVATSTHLYDEGPNRLTIGQTAASVVSSPVSFGVGAIDQSSTTGGIFVNDADSVWDITADWTVAFHWRTDALATSGSRELFTWWRGQAGERGVIVRWNFDGTDTIRLLYSTDGNTVAATVSENFTPAINTDYEFFVVHDSSAGANGEIYIYINETLELTATLSGAINQPTISAVFGNQSGGSTGQIGFYDNIRAWDKVVTPTAMTEWDVQDFITGISSWWIYPQAVQYGTSLYVGATTKSGTQWIAKFDAASGKLLHREILGLYYNADDHNAPAIRQMNNGNFIVAYTGHGDDVNLRYRIGADIDSLGSESTLTAATNSTYVQIFINGDDVFLFTRRGSSNNAWMVYQSTDNGSTWDSGTVFLRGYSTTGTSNPAQTYIKGRQSGTTVRFLVALHPSEGADVKLLDLDLSTGDFTVGGASIANLDGTGLELHFIDDLPSILSPDDANHTIRLFDFADDGEAYLYAHFDTDLTPSRDAMLRRATLTGADPFDSADWTHDDIVDPGAPFYSASRYFGGAQFDRVSGSDDTIYMARESSGTWTIEKRTTSDGGTTWPVGETVASSATNKLIRPVCPVGANSDAPVVYQDVQSYTDYNTFSGSATVVKP